MKSNIKKSLKTYLELNKRFGYGYQARMVMDGIESILDSEPFTLDDAISGTNAALEEINKATKSNYKLHEVLVICDEGLQKNKARDVTSARVAKDIKSNENKYVRPANDDFKTTKINGEEEVLLSGRGTVILTFSMWRNDDNEKAGEALKRYCEYLAMRGYGKGSSEIWNEIKSKNLDDGTRWVTATYDKYINNDSDVINYVLGG